ncbi:MAG TPA: hypothetical protein VGJ57_12805 [Nitrospirales bacterium]|jgi:hypothetical protein
MTNDNLKMEWPIAWSAVWVGALAALAVALIFGLAGIALGAHKVGVSLTNARELGLGALFFSVCGAFFSFVVGAWITSKLAGYRQAEPAIIHGGVVWLVTVPMLLILAALGAGTYFGGWYSGLAGTPTWVGSRPVDPNAAAIVSANALGAAAALLIGLVGSVIGGWMGSGEPMSPWHRRVEQSPSARRAAN